MGGGLYRLPPHQNERCMTRARKIFYALKSPYNLHIVAFDPRKPGAESTYRVMRQEAKSPEGPLQRTKIHLWRTLSHALYLVGCDVATIAAVKSDLDKTHSTDIPNMLLDDVNLRTIGFTDI
jgi:hypothetical protein